MSHFSQAVKETAIGRWPEIHLAIGIPAKALSNRHQPCPACGGKDRYRYDNKGGKGTFICSHYNNSSGDGFGLVMHFLQCDFQTALKQVAGVLGMSEALPLPIPVKPLKASVEPMKDNQAKLLKLWSESQPITQHSPVMAYLRNRGLSMMGNLPQSIRYAPSLPYWCADEQEKPLIIGRYPAMLSAITDLNGELQGLHRVYLQPKQWLKLKIKHPQTGEALDAKKMLSRYQGSVSGNAVQLYPMPVTGRLMVAEGIESALAARELFSDGMDYGLWASLSANGLEKLVLPLNVKELLIVADHDSPRPIGGKAAHDLAVRAIKAGVKAKIWQSETAGYDPLDELNRTHRPAGAILEGLNSRF